MCKKTKQHYEPKPQHSHGRLEDVEVKEPKFNPGRIHIDDEVKGRVDSDEIVMQLIRHMDGIWGEVSPVQKAVNNFSLTSPYGKIVSVHETPNGERLVIRTDENRRKTHIQLFSGSEDELV